MAETKAEIINSRPINTKFAPTCTAAQKYVSMFRIGGVPILPPLMTPEKHRQMHKLKEKAIKVEQRLKEYRQRREQYDHEYSTEVEALNEPTEVLNNELNSSSGSSSSTASVHESELDAQRKEVEKSYMMLTDLLIQNKNETTILTQHDDYSCAVGRESYELDATGLVEPRSSETNLMQCMQKLQKSETLIFDHRAYTAMQPFSEDEVQIFQQQQQQINLDHPEEKEIGSKIQLQDVRDEENTNTNLGYITRQKSMTSCTDKVLKKIPSICIDPPTPINGARTFCDAIQARTSIDAINVNDANEKPFKEVDKTLHEELSSDESSNCLESATNLAHDLKTNRKVTKITSKILKFENFSVSVPNEESPKRSNIRPPQRSATSPALKLTLSDRAQPVNKTLELTRDGSQNVAGGLVRSNSFTLDYPSKALIEHIRQQQTPSTPNDHHHYPTKRTNLISTSITRDTVESKAKRVQKVDLKPRTQTARLQLKPSSANITNPSATTSYQSSISKNKRSPYDTKTIKPKIARQLKKSVSGTSAAAIKQMKPRPSMPSIQSAKLATTGSANAHAGNTSILNTNYSGIEAEHRKKFLELLAHQKREQQRMQQVFEEQQQYLLEQLTAKMSSVHMQQQQQPNATSPHTSSKMFGGHISPVDNSPTAKSDYNESLPLQSPTRSFNSSIACELPSLELSARSSTIAPTSQSSNTRTPRRRLFSRGDISPTASNRSIASFCSNNGGVGVANSNCVGRSNVPMAGASSSRLTTADIKFYKEAKRREAAVTTINAYVRGYLVRRLFQTEQVQRIVQTIKDTLMFVLSLHIETCQDPVEAKNPSNIKLKTQLVKQLTSAIRTLHLILFNTSVKERMEIISRDRKRIKTKMLTMNMKSSPQFRI